MVNPVARGARTGHGITGTKSEGRVDVSRKDRVRITFAPIAALPEHADAGGKKDENPKNTRATGMRERNLCKIELRTVRPSRDRVGPQSGRLRYFYLTTQNGLVHGVFKFKIRLALIRV